MNPATASRLVFATIGLFLGLTTCTVRVGSAQSPSATLIRGATVLIGDTSPPRPGIDVLVADGTIRAVAPTGSLPDDQTKGARIVEADGRFLVPGFVESHAHLTLGPVELQLEEGRPPALSVRADPEVTRRSLLSLLAHGITTVRDPGSDTERGVALRDRIGTGEILGPRLFVAGRVIDHHEFAGLTDAVENADGVRRAVREQVEAGVDMVKLYTTLTPEEVAAGVDEAHRLGVPAVAHLHATSWTEAAQLGLDHLVHIIPGSSKLLPEQTQAEYDAIPLPTRQFFRWFHAVDLDGPEIQGMLEALRQSGTSVDPTMVAFDAAFQGNRPFYKQSPDLSLAAPSLVENWNAFFTFDMGWSPTDYQEAQAAWPKVLELTRRLHDAGVLLTAGTDANNPWIVPGPSFHRELELFVDAGIPPLQVLAIGARNGARVLGIEDRIGTIEEGKEADLVLLRSDPSVSIEATRDIEWVMLDGRILAPESLLAEIDSGS